MMTRSRSQARDSLIATDLDHPEEESPTNASKMDLTSEVSSVDDSLLCEEDANLEESELDDETYSFLLSSDFTVARSSSKPFLPTNPSTLL